MKLTRAHILKKESLFGLGLLLAFCLVYFKLMHADFMSWDDAEYVLENKDVHNFNLKALATNPLETIANKLMTKKNFKVLIVSGGGGGTRVEKKISARLGMARIKISARLGMSRIKISARLGVS